MLSILADTFRIATYTSRWDAPDHWRNRKPENDAELARRDRERNRKHYPDRPIR